jgi:hypothetical protein
MPDRFLCGLLDWLLCGLLTLCYTIPWGPWVVILVATEPFYVTLDHTEVLVIVHPGFSEWQSQL